MPGVWHEGFFGSGLESWLVSLNDLKSKIASGVASAGFDGDLCTRLDWWTGVGYYDSAGWDHRGPGHVER